MSAITTYRIVGDDGVRQTTSASEADDAARDGARVTAVAGVGSPRWRTRAFDRLEHEHNPYRDFADE